MDLSPHRQAVRVAVVEMERKWERLACALSEGELTWEVTVEMNIRVWSDSGWMRASLTCSSTLRGR